MAYSHVDEGRTDRAPSRRRTGPSGVCPCRRHDRQRPAAPLQPARRSVSPAARLAHRDPGPASPLRRHAASSRAGGAIRRRTASAVHLAVLRRPARPVGPPRSRARAPRSRRRRPTVTEFAARLPIMAGESIGIETRTARRQLLRGSRTGSTSTSGPRLVAAPERAAVPSQPGTEIARQRRRRARRRRRRLRRRDAGHRLRRRTCSNRRRRPTLRPRRCAATPATATTTATASPTPPMFARACRPGPTRLSGARPAAEPGADGPVPDAAGRQSDRAELPDRARRGRRPSAPRP